MNKKQVLIIAEPIIILPLKGLETHPNYRSLSSRVDLRLYASPSFDVAYANRENSDLFDGLDLAFIANCLTSSQSSHVSQMLTPGARQFVRDHPGLEVVIMTDDGMGTFEDPSKEGRRVKLLGDTYFSSINQSIISYIQTFFDMED